MPDPNRNPAEWFGRFLKVHMGRFPGMTWPDPDGEEFVEMVEGWLHHFRERKITQHQANQASLALMLVPHHPNNHAAEFFRAVPERPIEYLKGDPEWAAHWIPGSCSEWGRRPRPPKGGA